MHGEPAIAAVQGVLDASEAVDLEAYLPHVTEDVVILPPGFVIGPQEIRGHAGIEAGLERLREILGTDRELHMGKRRFYVDRADESKILVVIEITIASKRTAESFGTEAAMLTTITGNRVSRIESYTTGEHGLAQLRDPVAVDV